MTAKLPLPTSTLFKKWMPQIKHGMSWRWTLHRSVI